MRLVDYILYFEKQSLKAWVSEPYEGNPCEFNWRKKATELGIEYTDFGVAGNYRIFPSRLYPFENSYIFEHVAKAAVKTAIKETGIRSGFSELLFNTTRFHNKCTLYKFLNQFSADCK